MIGTDLSLELGGSRLGCVFRYGDSYICHPLAPLLLLVELGQHETTHNTARGRPTGFQDELSALGEGKKSVGRTIRWVDPVARHDLGTTSVLASRNRQARVSQVRARAPREPRCASGIFRSLGKYLSRPDMRTDG